MTDDPRDLTAYRLAIALLGVSLVAAIIGVAWVCAEHWCVRNVPNELWFMVGAVGGVFVGALIPMPIQVPGVSVRTATAVLLALLILACSVSILIAALEGSLALYAVGVTLGGALLGLPIPSPGRRDP